LLAAGQELSQKLVAAVLEKEELETQIKTVEERLTITEQQHKQALANLEKQHNEQLTVLKQHDKQQLGDLEVQHEHRVTAVETQYKAEITELKKINDQLGKLRQETNVQLDQLRAKNAALEMELNEHKKPPTTSESDKQQEYKDQLRRLEAEKSRAEKQLQASEDWLRKMEMEKSIAIKTSEELRESLEREIAGLQMKLEESDQKCEALVTREHESMQREHALVVAALQEKLAEKNVKDRTAVSTSSQVLLLSCITALPSFDMSLYLLHSLLLKCWQ